MSESKAIISVHSDDVDISQLKSAIIDSNNSFAVNIYNEGSQRDFQSIEWLMYTMMIIPVTESALNIALAIKNEIAEKLSKHLKEQHITKKTKISIKIRLPLFSYEKEEEIIIDPKNND